MKREIIQKYIQHTLFQNKFINEIEHIKNIPKMPNCEFKHIGSTAFNKALGEEILDILVTVENLHEITNFDEKRLNYINYHRVAHSEKGLISYCKINNFTKMTYDVKLFIVQKNSQKHDDFLQFYNILNTDKIIFEEYQNFKKNILIDTKNTKDYYQKKSNFIKEKLIEARKC